MPLSAPLLTLTTPVASSPDAMFFSLTGVPLCSKLLYVCVGLHQRFNKNLLAPRSQTKRCL